MSRSLSSSLIKGIEYMSLPFQYPRRFFPLLGKIFADRTLVHELPRLSPYRDWFRQAGIRTVIDVGGFVGSFAYAIRTMLPDAQIYSFEPLDENYHLLVKNLCPFGNFQAFQTALGDQSGTVDFFKNDFTASSSILEMADLHRRLFPLTRNQVRVTVPLARLDDYLDRMDLHAPVLMKLDVQGYEAAVLRGAERTLRQVDYIVTEVSFRELYASQPLFDEIHALLVAQGFRYAGSLDSMFSPADGSILQADALFIRNPETDDASHR
jgi:FkbM family methyltransferase